MRMSADPENLVLQLLRDMRAETAEMRAVAVTKDDIADLRAEMTSLRADVASDFIDVRREIATVRKDLSNQVVGLRRALVEYHTSVIGHGVLISELDDRMRRVERHLDLPASDAH